MANQQLANSFRVLAGKEQVDYSKKEYAQSNVVVIRKPWEWQKKVYQNLELHLDAAIDKVDNLAKDVELQRMEKKWDELYEQTHQESKEAAQPQALSMVSEQEYEYGAEAFEAYMKENKREFKPEMKENIVPENYKER
jgi:translation initiation factor 2 alpha subunit (eIF-2alpha)